MSTVAEKVKEIVVKQLDVAEDQVTPEGQEMYLDVTLYFIFTLCSIYY